MNIVGDFFHELRRRKVFQSAVFYIVGAWVALQVADLAFPGLGIPEQAIRHVWIGAFVGFPLALIFAWRYQVTNQGIVRTAPTDSGETTNLVLNRQDYLILGLLLLVVGGVTYQLVTEIRQLPIPARLGSLAREIAPNSIAVLPLQNVTGDPEQEYFVAGMHDALITDLSKIGALTVISRSSANVYRNVVQAVRQTGLELGVANIIEGSVFRVGDRVRINVQLIDTQTDENLWSENYERDIQDVLTLQSEVARAIADQIRVNLTPDEESRLAQRRQVNPQTYETYLKGMFHLNQYTPEGVERGLAYLHEAVDKDPADPLAYAGLALGYTLIGHSPNPPPGVWAIAREAAAKALELDPLFPEAHGAMAEIQLYHDWDWDGAEQSFRRALQLNPNLDFAHAHFGWYFELIGNSEKSIEQMKRARQIAPLTPIYSSWLGWLYLGDGRLHDAMSEAQKSLELDANFAAGLWVLGRVYAAKGAYEEAIATHKRLLEIDPIFGRWGLGETYALMGRKADARRLLSEIAENPGQKDLLWLGFISALIGDRAAALTWLEAAGEAHVDWFPWAVAEKGQGLVEDLRDEPSFQKMVEALGLPDPE
jgi:TolB-like protein/Tfp pilus assembly protein PilF